MKELLFDTPLWVLAVVFLAGAALLWSGNNRQDKTLKRLGLLVLLVGIALTASSYLFDTDKEFCERRTRRLVTSADKRDWTSFEAALDPNTSFIPLFSGREQIVAGAKDGAERIGLKSVRVLGTNITQRDTVITIDLRALSEQERSGGRPVVTDWRFDWQNLGTGWKLRTITPLKSDQVSPDQITQQLRR